MTMASPGFDLAALKAAASPILSNTSASTWDAGDDIAAFEIHGRYNICTPDTITLLDRTLAMVRESFRALLLVSDDPDFFSAGASLDPFIDGIERRDWAAVDAFLAHGQDTLLAMKYAPFPVIAAVHARTTSGGCEVALHASTIVAAETLHTGFRERWVAIVPGWGGVTQMLARWLARTDDADTAAVRAFEVIADARTTRTAAESQASGVLRPTDVIVADRHQAIARAKALATTTAATFKPPSPPRLSLASLVARHRMLEITDRLKAEQRLGGPEIDACHALADLYTGADAATLSERELMARERAVVVELVKPPAVIERMTTIRATGRRPEDLGAARS